MRSFLIVGAVVLATSPALAHSWYDRSCCAENDCHPVPCEEITQNKDGDYVWHKIIFQKATLKPSHDYQCHVCHLPEGPSVLYGFCVYMPQTS